MGIETICTSVRTVWSDFFSLEHLSGPLLQKQLVFVRLCSQYLLIRHCRHPRLCLLKLQGLGEKFRYQNEGFSGCFFWVLPSKEKSALSCLRDAPSYWVALATRYVPGSLIQVIFIPNLHELLPVRLAKEYILLLKPAFQMNSMVVQWLAFLPFAQETGVRSPTGAT